MASATGFSDADLAVLGAVPLTPDDPDRVGRYQLLGLLGVGGMGRVYLGAADGRYVAVKVIRPELADNPQFRRRFAHELQAVSRLDAAFTAPLVDAQADATRPWMATEYVPGISLEDAVTPRDPLPVAAVWRLAAGAGMALVAIHQAGLIHRDLKPANLILALDGPKVIDFGVAHAADLSQLTVTGQHVGTPSYMAPEQARTGTVGPASDVFALGALLMFAATGKPPFGEGTTTEVLYRVVHELPDLAALADLDADLHALVERCLDKDPAARPDAAAVVSAVVNARLIAEWPEPVRSRIAPRAALAGRTLPVGPGAPGGAVSTPTSAGDASGLPRREAPAPPTRRRRGRLLLAAAAPLLIVAIAVTAALLGRGGATRGLTAAPPLGTSSPSSTNASNPSGPPAGGRLGATGQADASPDPAAAGGITGQNSNPAVPTGGAGSGGTAGNAGKAGNAGGTTPSTSTNAASYRYSFEGTTDGWGRSAGSDVTLAPSTLFSYAGSHSLAMTDTAAQASAYVGAVISGLTDGPAPGATTTAWIYVPSGAGTIKAHLYLQLGSSWLDAPDAVLAPGWQRLAYTTPATFGTPTSVGVQFNKASAGSVTIYLDAVTWG